MHKKVIYRKEGKQRVIVRTPAGTQEFHNTKHAKAAFREALKIYGQVYLTRQQRKQMPFNDIRVLTMTDTKKEK